MSKELASDEIPVKTVAPKKKKKMNNTMSKVEFGSAIGKSSMKRATQPEEIAKVIMFF